MCLDIVEGFINFNEYLYTVHVIWIYNDDYHNKTLRLRFLKRKTSWLSLFTYNICMLLYEKKTNSNLNNLQYGNLQQSAAYSVAA